MSNVSGSELTLSALGEHTSYAVAAGETDGYRVATGWSTDGTSRVWVRTLTRRTGDLYSGYYPYRYLNGSTRYWGWRMLHPTNGNNRQEIRGTTIHAVIPSGTVVALDEWELRDTVFAFDEGSGGVAVIKHMRNGLHGGVSEGEAAITDLGASGGFGVLGSHSGASSPNMQVIAVAIKWDAEPSFAQHQKDAADLGVYQPDDDVFSRGGFDLIYSAKDINGPSWPAHGFVTGRTLAAVGSNASVSNVSGAGLPVSSLGVHTKYAVAAGESDGYALGSGWSTGATSKIWVRTLTRKVGDLYSGYYPDRYLNGSTRYWGWRMLHPTNGANRHEIRGTTIHAVQPSGMSVSSSDWELRDTIYAFDGGTGGVATIRHLRNGEDSGLSEGTAAITDLGASGGFGVLGSHTGASSSGMQIVAVAIRWDDEPTLGQHRQAAADLGLYAPVCSDGTVEGEAACHEPILLTFEIPLDDLRFEGINGTEDLELGVARVEAWYTASMLQQEQRIVVQTLSVLVPEHDPCLLYDWEGSCSAPRGTYSIRLERSEEAVYLAYDGATRRLSGTLDVEAVFSEFDRWVGVLPPSSSEPGISHTFEGPSLQGTAALQIDLGVELPTEPSTLGSNILQSAAAASSFEAQFLPLELNPNIREHIIRLVETPVSGVFVRCRSTYCKRRRTLRIQPITFTDGTISSGTSVDPQSDRAEVVWLNSDLAFHVFPPIEITTSASYVDCPGDTHLSLVVQNVQGMPIARAPGWVFRDPAVYADDSVTRDAVEVYVCRKWLGNAFADGDNLGPALQAYGGAITNQGGYAFTYVVVTDESEDNGINLHTVAHELGHVVGFSHPQSSLPNEADRGTVMCPTGWLKDNPTQVSKRMATMLGNPLLRPELVPIALFPIPPLLCDGGTDCPACPCSVGETCVSGLINWTCNANLDQCLPSP